MPAKEIIELMESFKIADLLRKKLPAAFQKTGSGDIFLALRNGFSDVKSERN